MHCQPDYDQESLVESLNLVAVQHAHATDRFAREIVGILVLLYAARSRRLMRNPFGTRGNVIGVPFR